MSLGQWLALAVAALAVFWMLGGYNRLVGLRNTASAGWQPLDDLLRQRGDAVGPLVQALRGALPQEGAALDALLVAQARVAAAADAMRQRPLAPERAAAVARADAAMAAALARVLALLDLAGEAAQPPAVAPAASALRAAAPALDYARRRFNEAVRAYNDARAQWPTQLLARLYRFGPAGLL